MTGRSIVASSVACVLGPVSARWGCVRWCLASALASFRAGRLAMPCARCLSEISACFSSSISAPHGSPPNAPAALQACLSRGFAQRCGVPQAPERRTPLSFLPHLMALAAFACSLLRWCRCEGCLMCSCLLFASTALVCLASRFLVCSPLVPLDLDLSRVTLVRHGNLLHPVCLEPRRKDVSRMRCSFDCRCVARRRPCLMLVQPRAVGNFASRRSPGLGPSAARRAFGRRGQHKRNRAAFPNRRGRRDPRSCGHSRRRTCGTQT